MREELFKGKTKEKLLAMNLQDFAQLLSSQKRRSLKRGFTEQQKILLENIQKAKNNPRARVKTHCRDMVIIPEMLDQTIHVHNGKEFQPVVITLDRLGHRLGDFVMTRNKVKHSNPGIGATKSSSAVSVK